MPAFNESPALVVDQSELCALDESLGSLAPIPASRMFEIKKSLAIYQASNPGGEVFDASQGDGGASLPGVSDELLLRAHELQLARGTGYDQPFGTPMFRQAVVENYWGLDVASGWGPANVIACQGGRDALLKAYDAMLTLGHGRRGDLLVVSRVPWVSYNWGPYAVGANVLLAPGAEANQWALTAEGIAECGRFANALGGRRIAGLVVTSPDNPTGRSISLDEQLALGRAAFAAGIPFVLYDWIYHRVTDGEPHDLNRFLQGFEPAERARVMVLDGITKSLGASNIRNAHLLADERAIKLIASRASHGVVPSFHSQAVAIAAYRMGFDRAAAGIVGPTNLSRNVLRDWLAQQGIRAILGKGYYAFLDLAPWIEKAGLGDSAGIGSLLAEQFGVAVVPGVHFSQFGKDWIRFSYALPPERTRAAAERLTAGLASL